MAGTEIQSLLKLQVLMAIEKDGPVCGYALMSLVERRTGKSVSPSQVYPFLSELKSNGLVRASERGERDKRTYSLTPEGRALVSRLASKLGDVVEFAVKNKIKTCHHCGAEIYSGEHRRAGKFFCCPHCAEDFAEKGGVCEKCRK